MKLQEQDRDDNIIDIFTFKVVNKVNTVHCLQLCVHQSSMILTQSTSFHFVLCWLRTWSACRVQWFDPRC